MAQHNVANHRLLFVNPVTGIHTLITESYWNRVKLKFKCMKGEQESILPSYLDKFMWWERHGRTESLALASSCQDTALRYPVEVPTAA